MASKKDVYLRAWRDPQWESVHISKRPLRGPQCEILSRVERFVGAHHGGVMTIQMSRQSGKNDLAATLQRRHLWRRQFDEFMAIWIRTAPTIRPQIVNSKKRLREILKLSSKNQIRHPLFEGSRLIKEEGYIWRLGNASVEFISSGPQANVVGATASTCLDMDEAHKVEKAKFDEDFAPFTANTAAATLLWGVASNGLDTIEAYRQKNQEDGRPELNLYFPCDVWMDVHPPYRVHVEDRVRALGWDHPIIKTQYRLIKVAAEGRFLSEAQVRSMLAGDHERQRKPKPGRHYEIVIDVAAGNEEFNPDGTIEGEEETDTDSAIMWIYEVTPILASNGLFPVVRLVNLIWSTGATLPTFEREVDETIAFWNPGKVTIDAVGVGRQIAESMAAKYGPHTVNIYTADMNSVSRDCFDLLARLNFNSVLMFQDDGSPEWTEFERQCGWTKYAADKGRMKLIKPESTKHIDMIKGLTYLNQNAPAAGMEELLSVEGDYS
ncbi:MAG: hypothetical protein ACXWPM_01830 [Bdellovibrionota bacterium]